MFNLPIPPLPIPGMGLTAPVGVPVGTVVAFAGQIASSSSENYKMNIEALGWMICDGRLCEVSQYPELFAVLGYLYGMGKDKDEKDDPSQFKIPDYRGLFLRGVDNRNKDEGRKDPDGPRQLGSLQEDALKAHQHTYNALQAVATPSEQGQAAGASSISTEVTIDPIKPETSISPDETRPKNISVNYIIKYTNG
jgi:microcystin-dependent protein